MKKQKILIEFLRFLQDKKKSISQPEFCSIPSLNGKSAKKSQMFFKIVFTKLSSIVGLYCLYQQFDEQFDEHSPITRVSRSLLASRFSSSKNAKK